ncbi:hypothetical protein TRIUR3_07460 [Triticum urartu]|uniref:EGF-like domain-containing protein n=1 Tax=Triticum urartu TaxID=4572 RepID=M7YTI0_TRIUA|nr:hypothetical protein TRIUR3_07460 [Triticum urartu]
MAKASNNVASAAILHPDRQRHAIVAATTRTASRISPTINTICVPDAKKALSGANYGVSSHTGLFLRGGCREINASGAECSVPASVMSRLLRTAQCVGNDTSVTCFASSPMNSTAVAAPAPAPAPALKSAYPNQFLRWEKVEAFRCGDALTAALYGDTDTVLSLEFGVAELGWWVNGTCAGSGELCAANATCTDVDTPSGKKGHRCACQAGMNGDGFLAGDGCHYLGQKFETRLRPDIALFYIVCLHRLCLLPSIIDDDCVKHHNLCRQHHAIDAATTRVASRTSPAINTI